MKTEFRHLEFNIPNLDKVKSFYEDIFKYFEYVIHEESDNRIKFVSEMSDFVFYDIKEDHPHFDEFVGLREINFWVYSKNDVDRFYKEFLQPRGIIPIDNSPKYYYKNYYALKFKDPEGFTWEIFNNPHGDTANIKEDLRKNFLKEFIYSVLLFPMGFWYAYKLFFKHNHKIAGITCLLISIAVLAFYISITMSISSSITDAFNQANQYTNLRY